MNAMPNTSAGAILGGAESTLARRLGRRLEKTRLDLHFRLVERELRRAPVAHLSEAQKRNRETHIERVRVYRKRGEFPVNTGFPGKYVPYFRDDRGTLCAVGYLAARSGNDQLVDDVVAADNHLRIKDVTGGPMLHWIEESGLTQRETARIQPGYCAEPGYNPIVCAFWAILPILLEIFEFFLNLFGFGE